jgi:hypothetical protein
VHRYSATYRLPLTPVLPLEVLVDVALAVGKRSNDDVAIPVPKSPGSEEVVVEDM